MAPVREPTSTTGTTYGMRYRHVAFRMNGAIDAVDARARRAPVAHPFDMKRIVAYCRSAYEMPDNQSSAFSQTRAIRLPAQMISQGCWHSVEAVADSIGIGGVAITSTLFATRRLWIIDTVVIKKEHPYGMIDLFGTPNTEKLHVVDRWQLLDRVAVKDGLAQGAKENWHPGGP